MPGKHGVLEMSSNDQIAILSRKYQVQSHPWADYVTARAGDGRQAIIGLTYPYLTAVLFDRAGDFIEVRLRPLHFEPLQPDRGTAVLVDDPDFRQRIKSEYRSWQAELDVAEQPI